MPFSLRAVATSLVVTDPKSRSSSPTLRSSVTMTLAELLGVRDGFAAGLGRARQRDALLVLDLLHVLDGGRHRERAGEQVVAGEAGAHADELAALAEVFEVLLEDHLNVVAMTNLLARDGEGQERDVARALDGERHLALVAGAVAADAAGNDLAALGDEVLRAPAGPCSR